MNLLSQLEMYNLCIKQAYLEFFLNFLLNQDNITVLKISSKTLIIKDKKSKFISTLYKNLNLNNI